MKLLVERQIVEELFAELFQEKLLMIFHSATLSTGQRIFDTSELLCQISKLNFQSFQDFLNIRSSSIGFGVTIITTEWMKQASECKGRLDELTRFLHSAWSSWCHCWNTNAEFNSLFCCLDIVTCWLRSFGNDVRKLREFWKVETRFTSSILSMFVVLLHEHTTISSRKSMINWSLTFITIGKRGVQEDKKLSQKFWKNWTKLHWRNYRKFSLSEQ